MRIGDLNIQAMDHSLLCLLCPNPPWNLCLLFLCSAYHLKTWNVDLHGCIRDDKVESLSLEQTQAWIFSSPIHRDRCEKKSLLQTCWTLKNKEASGINQRRIMQSGVLSNIWEKGLSYIDYYGFWLYQPCYGLEAIVLAQYLSCFRKLLIQLAKTL